MLVILVIPAWTTAAAYEPAIQWEKTFDGDEARSVQQTTDRGYIIAGTKSGNAWLLKTDPNGTKQWEKTFGAEDAYSVYQTSDGGYIVAGWKYFDYYLWGDAQLWLAKTDSQGNTQWEKTFGGSSSYFSYVFDYAYSVQQTRDAGYIVVGYTFYGSSDGDLYLVKTNFSGNLEWEKRFGGSPVDWGHDWGHSVRQAPDSGYIITGRLFGPSDPNLWLIKTDASGAIEWNKSYGGPEGEAGYSLDVTSDGGYIVAGIKSGDAWLIKTDFDGNVEWDQTFGDCYANSVRQTTDAGYIVTGGKSDDVWLIKTDPGGMMEWEQTFGGSNTDWGNSVDQTSDNGYIVAGWKGPSNPGDSGAYLIKLGRASKIWCVDNDAPSDPAPNNPDVSDPLENGSTGHPFDTIQEAIDAAFDGDTVIVDDGMYTGEGNRDIDFKGKAVTVRSVNGPYSCIIDCRSEGRGFYFHSGEDANSVLDGFTITNGCAYEGGGIYCNSASPIVTNCIFSSNVAKGVNGSGGAINFYGGYITPVVKNCLFADNSSSVHGGAISANLFARPQIQNCTFGNNNAGELGGAIFCDWGSSPVVKDSIFRSCNSHAIAEEDFGYPGDPSVSIKYCLFYGNQNGDYGVYDSVTQQTSTIAGPALYPTNKDGDPLFVMGYYLSQLASGQTRNSPAVNAGSGLVWNLGMGEYTTRIDGVFDMGNVDMGYHYSRGVPKYQIRVIVVEDLNDPGIHGTVEPSNGWYYEGTILTLTARPEQGYCVEGWYDVNDILLSGDETFEIVVDTNEVFIIRFTKSQVEILLPHDNDEFYSGGSMRVEVKLTGHADAISIRFEGKIDPNLNSPALTFSKFSDDGKTLGDTTAGDGIYTTEIGLPKLTTDNHTLQVTAYVTTSTGTKTVSDSITFSVTGRPVGAPTVRLDITPQQGEIVYVGEPITITAHVNYPESGISPEKVYVIVYSTDGKELYRFDLPGGGEVYTKTHYFNESGGYKVDAIAEAPLGSGYAKASDSQDLNVCTDRLKVSLRVEPESPSGIYLSNQDVNLIATVTTERDLEVPPRVNVEGQIDLPNGEIRKIWFKNESWTSSRMIAIHRPFILETTGNYSVSVRASAPNYATELGAGILFEVTEGLPAKLSDELKRIYGPAREAERLLLLMRDEGEAVAEDGDFLYVEKQEKQLRTYLDICFGLLDASLPDFGSKKLITKWIEEWAKSGVLDVTKEEWIQATFWYWQLVGTETGFLKNLYDEYEKQKFVSTSDNIIEAIENLDLYPMQRSVEEFYINDFRRRMAANWFLYGRGMCKYNVVHRLRDELDRPWNPVPDLAVGVFVAALVVFPPTCPIGIAAGLLQSANDAEQDWSDMKKAERGFTLAFEGVCSLHTEAKTVEDNLVDFASQVKTYDQTAPQGKITIVDATPDVPGSQEFMTGKIFTEWLLFIPIESYCIRTSWARLIIKNTGPTAAAFSVNATFSDTDFISQLAWLMKDKTAEKDCSSVFLAPGEEHVVDLYFLNLASNPIFNYFPDHRSEVSNMAGKFYTNTKVPINYCLLATRKGNDLHIVDEIQDIYDPIEESDETSKNISNSLREITFEPRSFFEQQSEPNSYRMVEYPIWNTFTKRSIAKPYTYRDAITISNPWPLALAATVRQAISDRMSIQSIGDPGVVEVNEIVWQVELHPHETKTLTYDFAVVGAKVPQSGFITIPPATMSIYDALSNAEGQFESGNTRLRVWEKMPGDFNKDDTVNIADLAGFFYHWLEQDCNYPNWCGGADFDYKGSVDFNDFAIFAQNWGWTKILADIDADGDIDLSDYAILANQWEEAPGFPSADVTPDTGDGIVDFWDLAAMAEHWLEGTTP